MKWFCKNNWIVKRHEINTACRLIRRVYRLLFILFLAGGVPSLTVAEELDPNVRDKAAFMDGWMYEKELGADRNISKTRQSADQESEAARDALTRYDEN